MTHPANRWWLLLLWLWAALAFATLPPNVVRIHYHRTAGDYDGWGLHVWGDGLRLSEQVTWRKPLMPAGRTEHGIYFDLPVSPSADKIGFLLHRGEVKNTNRDMWLFISRHGREIWQLQDDDRIYPSPPPPFISTDSKAATAPAAAAVDSKTQQEIAEAARLLKELKAQESRSRGQSNAVTQELKQLKIDLALAQKESERLNAELAAKESRIVELQSGQSSEREVLTKEASLLRERVGLLESELARMVKVAKDAGSGDGAARQQVQRLTWALAVLAALAFAYVVWAALLRRRLAREQLARDESEASLRRMQEEQSAQQQLLLAKASMDPLTGLANRALFNSALERAVVRAQRHKKKLALLFIDLDRFKPINDQLGHEAGDYVLKTIAERFRGCLREVDTLARLGGDEFVVLVEELVDPQFVTGVAQKLVAVAQQPFVIKGQEVIVTSSIGVAIFPADGKEPAQLVKAADAAMYRAKEQGKNRFQFNSEQMNVHSLQRLALESSLKSALAKHELQVFYQAVLDLESNKIAAVETMLRWYHPDLGLVSPGQFLSLAEESGLIVPIGRWALKATFDQVADWRQRGLEVHLMLDASPRQLVEGSFVRELQKLLGFAAMPPSLVTLSVREGALMGNPDELSSALRAVRELGVRLAIEEFSGGALPLSWLHQLGIGMLKLDRMLVQDLPDDADSVAVVKAILAASASLGIEVIAAGVEQENQLHWLRSHGCKRVQGFLYKEPQDAAATERLLRA